MAIIKAGKLKRQIVFKNALFLTHDAMMLAYDHKLDGDSIAEEMMAAGSAEELAKVFDSHFGEYADLIVND